MSNGLSLIRAVVSLKSKYQTRYVNNRKPGLTLVVLSLNKTFKDYLMKFHMYEMNSSFLYKS